MNKKEVFVFGTIIFVAIMAAGLVLNFVPKNTPANNGPMAGNQYFFRAPTMATTSVGSQTQFLILSADSARQYASFCNSSTTIASFISLQIGATSTSPSGVQIPGGSCYEMTPEKGNLFTTSVYAQTTTGTSTLTTITQSLAN